MPSAFAPPPGCEHEVDAAEARAADRGMGEGDGGLADEVIIAPARQATWSMCPAGEQSLLGPRA